MHSIIVTDTRKKREKVQDMLQLNRFVKRDGWMIAMNNIDIYTDICLEDKGKQYNYEKMYQKIKELITS